MAKNKNEIDNKDIPKVLATTNVGDMICVDGSGDEHRIIGAKRRGKKIILVIEEIIDPIYPKHGW